MGNPNLTESRLDCLSLMKNGLNEPASTTDIRVETSGAIERGKRIGAYSVSEISIKALGNSAELTVGKKRLISQPYDPVRAGMLIVCLYNGRITVIDGFKRIAAAKASGYTHMLCGMLHGLNVKEMAAMRLALNPGLSAKDKFALAIQAEYPVETAVEDVLRMHGMSGAYVTGTISVTGIRELVDIMKNECEGGKCVSDIIQFLDKTGWKGLPNGTSMTVLKALRMAWSSINSQNLLGNGWPALIKVMQDEMPKHLLFTARRNAMEQAGCTISESAAKTFIKIMLNAQYGTDACPC